MEGIALDIIHGNKVIRVAARHASFEAHIRKHFDVYFDSVVPRFLSDGKKLADFSKPSRHMYRNGKYFFLSSLPEEATLVSEYFRHCSYGALAFDVGAYCGVSTYEMSRRFDHVIAFEPDPENRACLLYNIAWHALKNVTVIPCALAASTGQTRFFSEGSLASRLAKPEYTRGTFFTVDTMSLEDACTDFGVPDFIGMDIESAEVQVLDASRTLLKRENISLSIDTNHDEKEGWTFGRVEKILRECGYCVETERLAGFYNTWAWKSVPPVPEQLLFNLEDASIHLGRPEVACRK